MSGLFVPRNISGSGTSAPDLPPRSNPPEANKLDYQIQRHNGSTSVLEFSRQRLQLAKQEPRPSLSARVKELTKELGHLRQGIQFYRQCFEILQGLRETTYDVYQQLFLAQYLDHNTERMNKLITRLHYGLKDSVRREVEAEKCWMEFWGMNNEKGQLAGELI